MGGNPAAGRCKQASASSWAVGRGRAIPTASVNAVVAAGDILSRKIKVLQATLSAGGQTEQGSGQAATHSRLATGRWQGHRMQRSDHATAVAPRLVRRTGRARHDIHRHPESNSESAPRLRTATSLTAERIA